MVKGLLRSRGDRPLPRLAFTSTLAAPPLTRRSPRAGPWRRRSHAGSSAHAEIAPLRYGARRLAGRLLRSRGDRPGCWEPSMSRARAPPLTRRSPLGRRLDLTGQDGSSAHAEIAPASVSSIRQCGGLLRSRGDRPVWFDAARRLSLAPPLTRRSPLHLSPAGLTQRGSSAHAEIAPPSRAAQGYRPRLLRSRGERSVNRVARIGTSQDWQLSNRVAAVRTCVADVESIVRYFGIEVDDAVEIAEKINISGATHYVRLRTLPAALAPSPVTGWSSSACGMDSPKE